MRDDGTARTEDGITSRERPDQSDGKVRPAHPTVVGAHGFSAAEETDLDRFAERFADAGFAALVFDNRGFGASDGGPGQKIDPRVPSRGGREAITFAQTLPQSDPERIGVRGSSYSGGHVIVLGATDRRIRCVAAQVPSISGHRNARRLIRADQMAAVEAMFAADRRARFEREPPAMIEVPSEDGSPCALPTHDSFLWFTETGRTRAPSWRNEVTSHSVELFIAYEPEARIRFVSPTPLLLVVALGDHLAVADEALAAYEEASRPERLVCPPGGHFDAYTKDFERAAGAARDRFVEHLRP
ncbi:MAG: CocE/NonD family hydrolase [Geminicoccaceae bacterium]|nr:CocE/NonD family hydrolase [Geminicoccaceae bacterium]